MTEILADIEEDLARSQPIARTHTILELTLHISAWLKIARERLSASENRDPSPDENWPAIRNSWREALIELETEVRALENAIRSFPDDRLDQMAPADEPQTFYVLLHGVVQHSAYHAAQIMLLKRATAQ